MKDPAAEARKNLSEAKAKLEMLIASGQPCLVEHLPHGVTDVHRREDLERVVEIWQAEVNYHAGRSPPPPSSQSPLRPTRRRPDPFA